MLLVLHWVLSSFVDPYERFVMLLKSRSCIHHPNMHYSYTGGRHNDMSLHLDSPKYILLLHWEWTQKIYPIEYPPNKFFKVLVAISQKFYCRKKALGYAKVIHKKRKSVKKMDKCPRYLKQWVLRCPPEKKRKDE